jgi:hypothetical protein
MRYAMLSALQYALRHVAGAAVALGGFVLCVQWMAPALGADDKPAAAEKAAAAAKPLAFPPGARVKELDERKDILGAFEDLTESAMTAGGFDDMVGRLVDQDRDRIGKFKDQKFPVLDEKVRTFRTLWKDKYGKDFDKVDGKDVLGGGYVAILTGEVADPAALAPNWPVPPVPIPEVAAAVTAAEQAAAQEKAREARKIAGGEVNLDKGRNIALARIPAGHGMPEVTASLIHELPDKWRFDIPNNVTGQVIHDCLVKHVDAIGTDSTKWPADMNDAYRLVTHHVVMAVYGVDPQAADAKPAGARAAD